MRTTSITVLLDDLAGPTRLYVAGSAASLAFALGPLVLVLLRPMTLADDASLLGFLLTAGLGIASMLAVAVGWAWWVRSADRRLRETVAARSVEVVEGRVDAVPVPARVVRTRPARTPGFLAGARAALPGPSVLVAAVALTDGGARRVGVLVPAGVACWAPRTPMALLLHPADGGAAVLDDRVGPGALEGVDRDPRWQTTDLPSDRGVVGGGLALAGAWVVGALAGGVAGCLLFLALRALL